MTETSSLQRRKFLRLGVFGALLVTCGCTDTEVPTDVKETKPGGNRKRLDDMQKKTESAATKQTKK